jgi:hypothetical protein
MTVIVWATGNMDLQDALYATTVNNEANIDTQFLVLLDFILRKLLPF